MSLLRLSDGTPVSTLDVDAIAMSGYRYSTDEICVGCWTDGKPIYRKVIETTVPSATTMGIYASSFITFTNDKRIVNLFGITGDTSTAYQYIQNGYINTTNNTAKNMNIFYRKDMGGIAIMNSNTNINGFPIKVVVEYTKSTDLENSFTLDMLFSEPSTSSEEATEAEITEVFA